MRLSCETTVCLSSGPTARASLDTEVGRDPSIKLPRRRVSRSREAGVVWEMDGPYAPTERRRPNGVFRSASQSPENILSYDEDGQADKTGG